MTGFQTNELLEILKERDINKDGRQKSLGYYNTKEEAIKARRDGEVLHYGDFAPNKQDI